MNGRLTSEVRKGLDGRPVVGCRQALRPRGIARIESNNAFRYRLSNDFQAKLQALRDRHTPPNEVGSDDN